MGCETKLLIFGLGECVSDVDCDSGASCTNLNGSLTCSCDVGFGGNGSYCEDEDECATGANNCSYDASCTNTAGSFTCTCNFQYYGDGITCMGEE